MLSENSWRGALAEDWENGGFGLYIHWPFCQAKCPYCDFNSHVAKSIDQTQWGEAYLREIDRVGALTSGRTLQTVFFGGGTPSLMDPKIVDAIMNRISKTWSISNSFEATLEANPSSVEADRFAAYAASGVNRISMGFQALNDRDLSRLGRIHTVAEGLRAYDIARARFERVNFDLIYARQDQTLAEWEAELKRALLLAFDHLSAYQLTIEEGTAFGDRFHRGKLRGLPSDDLSAEMYELTQDICNAEGMPAYEISNHARDGAESRHNMIYWRYGDYAGIGPGAHGRLTLNGQRTATAAERSPGKWLQLAASGKPDIEDSYLMSQEQGYEYLILGLRVRDGIDMDRYARMTGQPLDTSRISDLQDLGLVQTRGRFLFATAAGRLILNSVIETLIPD